MDAKEADSSRFESRDRLEARYNILKTERAPYIGRYADISKLISPKTGRFVSTDRNSGNTKFNNIYDNSATRALKIMAAGMMAGATSPSRPWFKLEHPDPDLNKVESVRLWLDRVLELMYAIFAKSNVYRMLHQSYIELGLYGTHATIIHPCFKTVIHCHTMTAGQYCIASDHEGRVDTLFREIEKTVYNTVQEFGLENVSERTRRLYEAGTLDAPVKIIHAIEPRAARDPSALNASQMPYASLYWEESSDNDRFLSVSGFNQFRVLAPRWEVSGGDDYGSGPGDESIGDIRQLQHQQLRKAQAIDYKVRPPMQGPTSLKNKKNNTAPGGFTYVDTVGNSNAIQTLFDVNLDLNDLQVDMQDVRQRINASFYADMFLMLTSATDTRMTATEVAERHEEKLLMLGPVLERLHNELLEPLVNITFDMIVEAELLPDPPPEIEGAELKVVFVSMLAQAQKAIGLNSIDRFIGGVAAMTEINPEVTDKINFDAWVDESADKYGIDPTILISTEDANKVRAARAKMQAEQQKAEMAQQHAATAKDLSQAQTSEPSVLSELAGADPNSLRA